MKLAIMGAGAVGGYFGARLAAAGNEVTFIARGTHLEAIRRDGLRVESAFGDVTVNPASTTDAPAGVGVVDVVLFTPKLWDTQAAAHAVKPLVGDQTVVASLQNGVVAADVLSRVLGRKRVAAGVAGIAATIARPGVIRHTAPFAWLQLGELDGRPTRRLEALLKACQAAGIDVRIAADIVQAIWEKFVFLVGFSALTTLTRQPIGPIVADPDTRALLVRAMQETEAVARAEGVDVAGDLVRRSLNDLDAMPPETTSSMAGDLANGKRLELEWLSGTVARRGAELGIDTPVNRFVAAALKLSAGGQGSIVLPDAL